MLGQRDSMEDLAGETALISVNLRPAPLPTTVFIASLLLKVKCSKNKQPLAFITVHLLTTYLSKVWIKAFNIFLRFNKITSWVREGLSWPVFQLASALLFVPAGSISRRHRWILVGRVYPSVAFHTIHPYHALPYHTRPHHTIPSNTNPQWHSVPAIRLKLAPLWLQCFALYIPLAWHVSAAQNYHSISLFLSCFDMSGRHFVSFLHCLWFGSAGVGTLKAWGGH